MYMDEILDYEETLALHRCWAFTVKSLSPNPTLEDYQIVLSRWTGFGLIREVEWEEDSHGKLHIHGIILLRKNLHRKKLVIGGFHMRLDELYDESGWLRYINKDKIDNTLYMF